MIEVELEKREQNHPALEHPQWMGRHGRFWDFDKDFIEFDSPGNKHRLDVLHTALDEVVEELCKLYETNEIKELITDYEVCGSYAFANQRPWSDLDIQLTTEDPVKQEKLRSILAEKKQLCVEASHRLGMRLKIRVELRYTEHRDKEYAECYSLRDRKLYNREPMTRRPDTFKRGWSYESKSFESFHREPPSINSDYWDEDGNELWDT